MSARLSIFSALPYGLAEAEGAARPQRTRVVCVVAAAWVQDFASWAAGDGTSVMPVEAEPHEARAIDAGPEVYCCRHGAGHASGFAPCSDLGCAGCTPGG